MSLQPKRLQLWVILGREVERPQYPVQLSEVSSLEGDNRPRLQHGFTVLQVLPRRQRPQEPRQPVHVAALLQNFAHARHLVGAEPDYEVW